eukprot:TRINITY_DN8528_c1_g1_i1.p1 TRINITY_DN8528_c1_g1~~TRINITY_DN8528_c1_g1_i1.p1  ORF type:complete len:176 (+),score=44.15 TRINITY_DN8528_c1_g1_i1:187-714(+)
MAAAAPEAEAASPSPQTPGSETNKEKRFGQNSYHYWHDHGKERAALGDVAPMPKPTLVARHASDHQSRKKRQLSKYSWDNGKKFVNIYCDYPGIEDKQDIISVKYGKASVRVCVAEEKEDVVLELVRLNGKIIGDESELKIKPGRLQLKLRKAEETTWYDLKKTGAGACDSDSDE